MRRLGPLVVSESKIFGEECEKERVRRRVLEPEWRV